MRFIFIIMVEQFVGTWTLLSSENFDEYMKAIGVGFATRQMGNMAKPNLVISVDDAGMVSMKSETTFKTTEIKFKLNEEFDETTADGRKTKVGHLLSVGFIFYKRYIVFLTTKRDFQTLITCENGKLVQQQTWEDKKTTLEREIQDGKLTAKCVMDDVVAVRTYEKGA
ncbi:hypothetical protein F7725_018537 [Dissostichus mawsoni]|uniref:Cytosolic fatty-acid binding proteins domain-containing protein n=1 Tax=Dissostichus mawsoni TaxID=36200 RepID=A0A7J5XRU9_DISMA|nr:hypothetical protein F7725_018537 [Dissostichus mawsoni]